MNTDKLAGYRNEDGTLSAYAWPGGYPLFYFTRDGLTICPACANRADVDRAQMPVAAFANWEDPNLECEDCGERIPSAYAKDERES